MSQCVGSYVDPASGQNTTREWSNTWPNFDNVGNSLLVCFMVRYALYQCYVCPQYLPSHWNALQLTVR